MTLLSKSATWRIVLAVFALSGALSAGAHQDHSSVRGFYGGPATVAGPYLLELCADKDQVEVLVFDNIRGRAEVNARHAVGSLELVTARGRYRVELLPAGGNVLVGTIGSEELSGTAVVDIRFKSQTSEHGRFRGLDKALACRRRG